MPGASHTADVAEYVDSCLSQQIVSDFGVMVKRQFLCQVGDANIETFNTLLGQHIYKAAIRYERELADVLSAVYAHEPAPFGPISSQYAYPAFVNIMLSEPNTAAFSQPLNCKKPHIDWFMRRRIRLYADILTEEEQCEAFHHAFSAFLKCNSDLRQQFCAVAYITKKLYPNICHWILTLFILIMQWHYFQPDVYIRMQALSKRLNRYNHRKT